MAEPSRRRRRRSYASESTPPARGPNIHGWISDDGRHKEYLQMWKERKVLRQKFVDLNWFTANQFQFSRQLVEQGVQHLLQLQGRYYPDLVRVFYYNLKAHNGIVYTRVKGVDIVLDHDIWTNVAHLPILENNLHVPNDFGDFNKIFAYRSFMSNPQQPLPNRRNLQVGHLRMEERVLHYLIVWLLCPRGVDVTGEKFLHVLPTHQIEESALHQMGFIRQGNMFVRAEGDNAQDADESDEAIPMPDPTNVVGPSHPPQEYSLETKETLFVELVKYCYGDRGIAGSSLVYLRKCSEEEVILREVFGGSVSSFVKIQRRCWFISCGIKRDKRLDVGLAHVFSKNQFTPPLGLLFHANPSAAAALTTSAPPFERPRKAIDEAYYRQYCGGEEAAQPVPPRRARRERGQAQSQASAETHEAEPFQMRDMYTSLIGAQLQSIHRGQVATVEMIVGMYVTPPAHRWTMEEFHNVVAWLEEQVQGDRAGAVEASAMEIEEDDVDDDEDDAFEDAKDEEEEEDTDDSSD
ncbi:hypothetical protein LR48_Vigan07g110500 [Vigna angularis]|uniref:Uncharacterized protein n=1 Tax=Phaseolus angularis TaxID=3914 RepID=A0A0L9UXE5_PHAAN|nr:hypothetical protein LR48_Vigan07g110500 [Vigna angularis]